MTKQKAVKESLALVGKAVFAMLGTVDGKGYPDVRAMLRMENRGMKEIWFSTNTSSQKVAEIKRNPRACVYFIDFERWAGLTLTGAIKALRDPRSRKRLWKKGFEKYYPLGVNDPDYSVLLFIAKKGKYYHNLSKTVFNL